MNGASQRMPLAVHLLAPHHPYTPKKLLRTVATTTRKMQLPNHAAAVLEVSGSPEFHLLKTLTAPTSPTTAPTAYSNVVAVAKIAFD